MRRPTRAEPAAPSSALAPFRVRNFRFQWPADLSASWAFEMEALILGWYILVETGSVFLLTAFASLQWIGVLVAPLYGVVGDRIGHRNLLLAMRAFYALQAGLLMALAFTGALTPWLVFIVSGAMSMVRPSDLVMRYALVGNNIPSEHLMAATSIERTTSDSARVVGALSGAGLIASLGIGPAYVVIAAFYVQSVLLTLGVRVAASQASRRDAARPARLSPRRDLLEAFRYVQRTPLLFGTMWLAFLVNFTAYPVTLGLLPYVAKNLYHTDQTGLGYLVAGFAFGALIGSLALMRLGRSVPAGRTALACAVIWYAMLAVFAHQGGLAGGVAALVIAGVAQSCCLIPMSAVLLRHAQERYRARVMGIRMFAIYGLPIGLLMAGPLVASFGFAIMVTLYSAFGIACTLFIARHWRAELWRMHAPANRG
ncbi:MAG: MFS transporter [Burkholderiales bacterium]|nr:MFS transporter [Burkholderiales bacterium]